MIVTFCAPQPAAADEVDLGKRCAQTTLAFIGLVDEDTSFEEAERKFKALHPEDKEWLATTVFPAYKLAGEPPLENAVPVVYRNCLKRGAV